MNRLRSIPGTALALPILAAAFVSCAPKEDAAPTDEQVTAIHDRVMTMDTHVDISPANFQAGEANYATRLPRTQVDVDKMEKGGLDAAWLVVYTGQGDLNEAGYARAYEQAMEKFAGIHRLTDTIAPSRVGLALTSDDARRIYESGRKVIFIGVENGYPIGTDVSRVEQFYNLGARYLSLAHNGHSQLSDSNTGERDNVWLHDGLSPLGKQVVAEANRLGIMLDVSHPSKQAMLQMAELSRAPIMASHSGVRAICGHSRNMDDEQLQALAKNGGVIQLVAFSGYVKCDPEADEARNAQRDSAMKELRSTFGLPEAAPGRGGFAATRALVDSMPEDRRNDYTAQQEAIMTRFAAPRATVSDFVDHIDHVVKLIGIDHAGISSDFDGGGGVEGWNSADETYNVTRELVKRGYTEEQIAKIWSGNLLRVLDKVQEVAKGSN
ncbi:MAG: dipeptidase [Gemmatimonadaceae bacterium]